MTRVFSLLSFLLLGGCFGTLHRVPDVELDRIRSADETIRALGPKGFLPKMPTREAQDRIVAAWDRVHGTAQEVCREVRIGSCTWHLDFHPDRDVTAGSAVGGRIEIYRGIAEQAVHPEEISLVVAHEMAHQFLNHPAASYRLAYVACEAGWKLGHVVDMIAALVGKRKGFALSEVAGEHGYWIGERLWARAREREADYFAVLILFRAGLDLEKAQQFNVNETRRYPAFRSTWVDMHPAGAERVALVERAVAEIRATNGRLPPRL